MLFKRKRELTPKEIEQINADKTYRSVFFSLLVFVLFVVGGVASYVDGDIYHPAVRYTVIGLSIGVPFLLVYGLFGREQKLKLTPKAKVSLKRTIVFLSVLAAIKWLVY